MHHRGHSTGAEENIGRSSPKLYTAIGDSIALARAILDRVVP
jgi:hypothetical protein